MRDFPSLFALNVQILFLPLNCKVIETFLFILDSASLPFKANY